MKIVFGLNKEMKKKKIVWICHFSNKFIQNKLPLTKQIKYQEFAPWIPNTINEIINHKDYEIFIISPHVGLKKILYHFKYSGINYYFFKADIPLIHNKMGKCPLYLNRFLHEKNKFIFNRFIIKRIVNKINPDLIHLHNLFDIIKDRDFLLFITGNYNKII